MANVTDACDTSSLESHRESARDIVLHFDTALTRANKKSRHRIASDKVQNWMNALKALKLPVHYHTVLFVGQAGHGKSTLINNILGEKLLCTSAKGRSETLNVIRIRFDATSRSMTKRFISESIWQGWMDSLARSDNEGPEEEIDEKHDDETDLREKRRRELLELKRRFYKLDHDQVGTTVLPQSEYLQARLGYKEASGPIERREISSLLSAYTSRHDEDFPEWAILKQLEVSGEFPICRSNIEIFDAPGLSDANSIRASMSTEISPDCLIYCVEARRVLEDAVLDKYIHDNYARGRILQNGLIELIIAVTWSDGIQVDEAVLDLDRRDGTYVSSDISWIRSICARIDSSSILSVLEKESRKLYMFQEAHNRFICKSLEEKFRKLYPKLPMKVVATTNKSEFRSRAMDFGDLNLTTHLVQTSQHRQFSLLRAWCSKVMKLCIRIEYTQIRLPFSLENDSDVLKINLSKLLVELQDKWSIQVERLSSLMQLKSDFDASTDPNFSAKISIWCAAYAREFPVGTIRAACNPKRSGVHTYRQVSHDWCEELTDIWLSCVPTLLETTPAVQFATTLGCMLSELKKDMIAIGEKLQRASPESAELSASITTIRTFHKDEMPLYYDLQVIKGLITKALEIIYASVQASAYRIYFGNALPLWSVLYHDLRPRNSIEPTQKMPGDESDKMRRMRYIVERIASAKLIETCRDDLIAEVNAEIKSKVVSLLGETFREQKARTIEVYKRLWEKESDRVEADEKFLGSIKQTKSALTSLDARLVASLQCARRKMDELSVQSIIGKGWRYQQECMDDDLDESTHGFANSTFIKDDAEDQVQGDGQASDVDASDHELWD